MWPVERQIIENDAFDTVLTPAYDCDPQVEQSLKPRSEPDFEIEFSMATDVDGWGPRMLAEFRLQVI